MTKPLSIFVTAGEASGDVLGARLMEALRREHGGEIVFSGVGGPLMEAQGLQSLFPMRDLSVMGIVEVLPRLNKILKRISQVSVYIEKNKPNIVVTIDAPDFSFRVAEQVRKRVADPPVMVHYVAPTVWAWRPERAAKVARLYDGILCLFPFEPPYFEKEGLAAAFIGHPALEGDLGRGDGAGLRKKLDIPADAQVLGILFGSRTGELSRVGPILRAAAEKVAVRTARLHILSLTLPHLEKQVAGLLRGLPCPTRIVTDSGRKADAFAAMTMALATSGTVGLELAVAGVPHVIGYKVNRISYEIIRRKVTVKYAHLANILLDRPVVPEFIQGNCTADNMATALLEGLPDQREAFSTVRQSLAGAANLSPSAQAARFVLGMSEGLSARRASTKMPCVL